LLADWLVGAYVAVMLPLIALSGCMAVLNKDAVRREDARKVLRLLVTAGAASVLIGLLAKFHELGLLR
jgi:formate-dependent nitrite reductase membrane component NrfD